MTARLRAVAARQGLALRPHGRGWLIIRAAIPGVADWSAGEVVWGDPDGATLAEVETFLLFDNRPGRS